MHDDGLEDLPSRRAVRKILYELVSRRPRKTFAAQALDDRNVLMMSCMEVDYGASSTYIVL